MNAADWDRLRRGWSFNYTYIAKRMRIGLYQAHWRVRDDRTLVWC